MSTIAGLAARQHGIVARVAAPGAQHRQVLDRRAPSGRSQLHLLHRGVYAVGHRRLAEGRWMAAVLACGPGAAVLCRRWPGNSGGCCLARGLSRK